MKFVLSDEQVANLAKVLGVQTLAAPEELLEQAQQISTANATLRGERTGLAAKAGQLEKLLGEKREAVKALIVKVDGENSKGLQAVVEKLEWEALGDLEKEYGAKLDAKLPVKCMDCGGTNCARRSSLEEPPKAQGGTAEKPMSQSNFKIQ